MKVKQLAQVVSLLCIASPVAAQTTPPATPAPAQKVEKVEITGSSIKRVQNETALPLQVITKEEIDKAGIVSAEQLVTLISANGNGADNLSSNMGVINNGPTFRNNFGNASANLRGIGSSSTLVLLNGRRVSLHGAKGFSVDLSSIPLAAIERVEVLKDGASSLYGTDAVGGVINFITKKEYKGVQLQAFADATHDGGGNIYRGNILAGFGDLAKDRFNAFASITFDRQEVLDPSKRSFVNGFQPDRGLSPDTTGTPFATLVSSTGSAINAAFTTPGTGTTLFTRANLLSFQGRCQDGFQMSQYQFVLWDTPSFRFGCAYDYGGQQILIQPVDRLNAVGRATWNFAENHSLNVEFTGYKTEATRAFEYSQITTSVAAGNAYPVNGPFYQNLSQFVPTFNATRPLAYRWRCVSCGRRTIETETQSYRALAALEGVIGMFDYKLGASTGNSRADSVLKDGYMRNSVFNPLLASGLVNIFLLPGQTQTASTQALIDAAKATGTKLFGGEATLKQVDGAISGEFWKLPGGPIGVAAGFDWRKEGYRFSNGATAVPAGEVIRDAPFDAEFPRVSRTIKAVYTEVALPLDKTLEVSLAVRRDKYSDFGDTTNPKYSFKWNPTQELLFRGSYNRGFRAPSFFQLYSPVSLAPLPGNIADPVLCPQNPGNPDFCAIRPDARTGGNPDLQPEKSKQRSFGLVFAPTDWLTANIDMWELRRKGIIYQLTPTQIVNNFQTFPSNFVRGATGRLNESGGFIIAGFVNADGDILKGYELGLQASTKLGEGKLKVDINGTYMKSAKFRVFVTDQYTEQVGQHTFPNLYIRWKHIASATYSKGPWDTTLTQQYTGGYRDEAPFVPPPGFNPEVDNYILYNVSVAYKGFKNLTLRGGIKNIFNTDPPFTAHNVDFSPGTGWEARVGDPRGRAYTLSATYTFK